MLPRYAEIVALIKKGATLEAEEKILELREGALELQEENLELREKVKELEDKLSLKKNVQWEKPHYWVINGEEKDGPYCQKCYDADQKLIRMQGGGNDRWTCNECKNTVLGPSYIKPQIKRIAPRTTRI